MEKTTISLLGAEWEPTLPPSFTARQEILIAYNEVSDRPMRAFGAAIGLCWNHPDYRLPFTYAEHKYDTLRFGGNVYDWLHGKGCDEREIATAAYAALGFIYESIPRQKDVEERADFSEGSDAPKE